MAGSVSVFAEKQFFISPGVPAANCKLSTYLAGTTTPTKTWQNRDQTAENTNPITLDANGMCIIWGANGILYDMVLRDPTNTTELDTFDDVSGALSSITSTSNEWAVSGLAATFVNATTFTVAGNHSVTGSKIYERGRRIRTLEGIVNKYGTVISSTFAAGITTVVCNMQGGTSITSGLTTVDYGILSVSSPSSLTGLGSVLNLTGYAGADVSLEVGQIATYTLSSVTSFLFRLATSDNQEYKINFSPTIVAGAAAGAITTLKINNVDLVGNPFVGMRINNATPGVGAGALVIDQFNSNNILLDGGVTCRGFAANVVTRTDGKRCFSNYFSSSNTQNFAGSWNTICVDIVTAWSSLGTLTFANPVSGFITVKREA